MDSKRGEGIIKKFQNELDIKQQEKNETEKEIKIEIEIEIEIDDVDKDINQLNWVKKFGDTIKLNMIIKINNKHIPLIFYSR